MLKDRIGLSGSTLKMVAIITMLIDHIGATVLWRLLILYHQTAWNGLDTAALPFVGFMDETWLLETYYLLRNIGRIAFPIFCFLLIEGFVYTRDRKKYALRLFVFALISEIPFDLAFSSRILETQYQNVFFTLLLGLLTIMAVHAIEEKVEWNEIMRTALTAAAVLAGMQAAFLLRTDYAAKGVMCILVLYLFRKKRNWQVIAGCLAFFWWEPWAILAFVPIALYNGKRGWNMKYFFYLFYPLHLLVLYAICYLVGISGIPAI